MTVCTWTWCESLPVSGTDSPGSDLALRRSSTSALATTDHKMLSPLESCPGNRKNIKTTLRRSTEQSETRTGHGGGGGFVKRQPAYHTYWRDGSGVIFETSEQGSFQRVHPQLIPGWQHQAVTAPGLQKDSWGQGGVLRQGEGLHLLD